MEKLDLSKIRKEIDDLDIEITSLLEKRLTIALDIAKYKIQNNMTVFDKDREKQVIEKSISYLTDKKYSKSIEQIYTQIMTTSKNVQKEYIEKEIN